MSISVAQMEIIDLTVNEVIDLSEESDVVQDIMYFIQQNLPQHQNLNGYVSDDGFVVAPGEGESDAEEDDMSDMEDVGDMGDMDDQQQPNGHVHSECTICLDEVTEADEGGNVTILPCGHTFHNLCMNGWLLAKPEGECPTCKGTIEGAHNM